jgi:dTDP-4-amino-4,6-dideoxygalactose transaminase
MAQNLRREIMRMPGKSKPKLAINGGSPIRDKFLVFGSPLIGEEEIREVEDTLRSGWLGTGPRTQRFEKDFRKYIGAKYALGLNSCTAGLFLALDALGVGPGDEVITTPLTFAATANVIVHTGATPVFADVDKRTGNISPAQIKKKITKNTKAVIPVHLCGRPCDMDPIMDLAHKHGLYVVEDAAHAIEARYKDKKIGAIGHISAFSFYATKNLVTGEGGMVCTNNPKWDNIMRVRSLHGLSKSAWSRYSEKGFKFYDTECPGYKYNMTDMQAALGIHQLRRIEDNLVIRNAHWARYDKAFKDNEFLIRPCVQKNIRHARHLYTPLLDADKLGVPRDEFLAALQKENIGAGIHFIALHLHSYYKKRFGYRRGDFPNAEYISDRTFSIPFSARLSAADVDDVIGAVNKVTRGLAR